MPSTLNLLTTRRSAIVRRVALILAVPLIATLMLGVGVALAGRHYGGNGPDGTPNPLAAHGNCAPYLFGRVNVDGVAVSDAEVTLRYLTHTLTTTTENWTQFKVDGQGPLYMFHGRPCNELGVKWGATVLLSAKAPGYPEQTKEVTMIANYPASGIKDQIQVEFMFGEQPIYFPRPAPRTVLPTIPISDMVSRHLFDAGDYHTCAVVGGGLRCWGWNKNGSTGSGDPNIAANWTVGLPVQVPALADVLSVATGADHTCVVMKGGAVKCWGNNSSGATGPNAPPVTHIPQDMPVITDAVDIVAGFFITCALLRDNGRVMCWGNNDSGQLGRGVFSPSSNPMPTEVMLSPGQPLTGVTALDAEGWHVCAVVAGGVKCWGKMHPPQESNKPGRSATPVDIELPTGVEIRSIATGYHASCAADVAGDVYCWGNGLYPESETPVKISGLPAGRIIDLAMNRGGVCALHSSGSVYCWGGALHDYQQIAGQYGANVFAPVELPTLVEGVNGAVDIAAGEEHICARLVDGQITCWGSNYAGQLGNGGAPPFVYPWHSPMQVTAYTGAVGAVTAGGYHTCALTPGGRVFCWGANGYGQAGAGFVSHVITQAINASASLSNVTFTAVSAGRQHTCALTADGAVYCWGRNQVGQLGNGTVAHSSVPALVSGLDGVQAQVQAIASGEFQTCALLADGSVRCWGQNGAGQLGRGNVPGDHTTPAPVVGLAGRAVSLAAGDDHMCAVIEGGAAQCWGYNAYGQLGNGTNNNSNTPVIVSGLTSGVTAMTAGRVFTCAIVNGSAKCWGDGHSGQLADGEDFSGGSRPYTKTVPVDVVELPSTVLELEAGGATACARLDNGETYCWGSDWSGQLGRGTANTQWLPQLLPLSGITQLSMENLHVCARLQDASLRCWGSNTFAQVGNEVSLLSPTPVEVQGLQPAQWTYMLYLAGDNDLSFFMDNISRAVDNLLKSNPSPALNVVIFYDGGSNSDGERADDMYIWSAGENELHRRRLTEAEQSTGNPNTLTSFIEWAHKNFPAQHYYLSIANHGRATSGIAWDGQNGMVSTRPDVLDPLELKSAIAAATQQGAWKIDVIHFDACLMALFEMAYEIKGYANYMIASQNLTAALYPYDEYASVVVNEPTIAPAELAKRIANLYFNNRYMTIYKQPRTISLLDLSKIDGVANALTQLASNAVSNIHSVAPAIAVARNQVQVFDASPDFTNGPDNALYFTLTKEDEYVDVRHLAELLRDANVADSVRDAAGALYNILTQGDNQFVVLSLYQSGRDMLVSGQEWNLDHSNGVSIFFPLAPGIFGYEQYIHGKLFPSFTAATQWVPFLGSYYAASQTQPVEAYDPRIPPVLKPSLQITHCPGMTDCIWGVVYLMGAPIENATVILHHPDENRSATTAILPNNELAPLYQLSLDGLDVQNPGWLSLTVSYSGVQTARAIRYVRNQPDGYNEQQVDIHLQDAQTPPPNPGDVQVAILWALAASPKPGQTMVGFHAQAEANDGSAIVQYEWKSDRFGVLGADRSMQIPVAQLPTGRHQITVKAVNDAGIESAEVSLELIINERRVYLPVVQR
ncbi:MAG: hypothetical protein KJZ95_05180 [Caldilinea sp.]|jgi:alpha-tubulin suppressor-like RCC1 family protein|nr:hypothetical protein [Caldilinea sp.]